jgi:hypothetical protein
MFESGASDGGGIARLYTLAWRAGVTFGLKVTPRRDAKVQRADHGTSHWQTQTRFSRTSGGMMQSIGRWIASTSVVACIAGTLACGRDISAPRDVGTTESTNGSPASTGQTRSDAVGLSVTPNALALRPGDSGLLMAALVDGTGAVVEVPTGPLPWTSSSSAVVTVTNAGVVTAVGAGEATVTTTAGGFSASARVLVMR